MLRPHSPARRPYPPTEAVDALVLRALRELAGVPRGLIYDVPASEAPARVAGSPVFLHGSAAWQRFLADREQLDDGGLTLVLALRALSADERRMVIDWGNTFANAFLLVEPRADFDLADRDTDARQRLDHEARRLLADYRRRDADPRPWTRDTALGALLREWYAFWICWPDDGTMDKQDAVPLTCDGQTGTLAPALAKALAGRYPAGAFDRAFERLLRDEPELFAGHTVEQARAPFLTRLGLPVVYEPGAVSRAVRRAVNAGRAWVHHHEQEGVTFHGPDRPLPAAWPDELIERLVL